MNFMVLILILVLILGIIWMIKKNNFGKLKTISGGGDPEVNRICPIIIENRFQNAPKEVKYIDPFNLIEPIQVWNIKSNRYSGIENWNQIQTVYKYGNINEYNRLIHLILKNLDFYFDDTEENQQIHHKKPYILDNSGNYLFYKTAPMHSKFDTIINWIKNRKWTDKNIYENIRLNFKYDETIREKSQSLGIIRGLMDYKVKNNLKFETYTDLGGKNGGLTLGIAKILNIDKKNIIITEIDRKYSNPKLKYLYSHPEKFEPLEIPDDSQDLITAFMVLHHVVYLEELVNDIYRILKPGGIFYIKEHDCWNAMDAMLIDIEHGIFMYCNDKIPMENIPKNHFCRYMNYYGVDIVLKKFNYLKGDYIYISPRHEITPTRAFWSVYQKPEK